MATWSKITAPITIADSTENPGPQHHLPPDAQPLDYLFLFLPVSFFENVAEETNMCNILISVRGRNDPWQPTSRNESFHY